MRSLAAFFAVFPLFAPPEQRCQVARTRIAPLLSAKPLFDGEDTNNKDREQEMTSPTNTSATDGETKSQGGGEQNDDDNDDDGLFDYAMDSFISGDYAYQFAENAPSPNPSLTPGETVDVALRALRKLDDPEPAHGAAVLMRFCVPLSRAERWGDSSRLGRDPWKTVLRGSLTPEMFAKRLRASTTFAGLLDWTKLDVTEGTSHATRRSSDTYIDTPNLAFVNAALFFGSGIEPALIQFTLKQMNGGVWMIDTARKSQKELFVSRGDND